MAALIKYTNKAALAALKHNTREDVDFALHEDIDLSRTCENFSLAPDDRGGAQPLDHNTAALTARKYQRNRLREIYCYGRTDMVTACEWVITAPADLRPDQEQAFWRATYEYLCNEYGGEKNCLQAIVHKDEVAVREGHNAGHLHFVFIPVVDNPKYNKPNRYGNISGAALYPEKLCANDLLTPQHLRVWHAEYQAWLDRRGIHATVHSGVTGGANRTVGELKAESLKKKLISVQSERDAAVKDALELRQALSEAQDRLTELSAANKALNARLDALTASHARQNGWGQTTSWGQEVEHTWDRA